MTRRLPRRSRGKSSDVDTTKISKLLRLLSSDKDGEVLATVGALKRALAATGKDLHDLATAAEVGLKPSPPPALQRRSLGPPAPSLDDWQSMSWWLHYHRHQLRKEQRELVADMLLGQGDGFDCGRVQTWAIAELRSIVAGLQARLRHG
jgi:hypothetical protein